eukprot:COSAG05_NODE_2322_length_3236_cov_2.431304_2_plen_70_part_00
MAYVVSVALIIVHELDHHLCRYAEAYPRALVGRDVSRSLLGPVGLRLPVVPVRRPRFLPGSVACPACMR